jgi:hypothetical protein
MKKQGLCLWCSKPVISDVGGIVHKECNKELHIESSRLSIGSGDYHETKVRGRDEREDVRETKYGRDG